MYFPGTVCPYTEPYIYIGPVFIVSRTTCRTLYAHIFSFYTCKKKKNYSTIYISGQLSKFIMSKKKMKTKWLLIYFQKKRKKKLPYEFLYFCFYSENCNFFFYVFIYLFVISFYTRKKTRGLVSLCQLRPRIP